MILPAPAPQLSVPLDVLKSEQVTQSPWVYGGTPVEALQETHMLTESLSQPQTMWDRGMAPAGPTISLGELSAPDNGQLLSLEHVVWDLSPSGRLPKW